MSRLEAGHGALAELPGSPRRSLSPAAGWRPGPFRPFFLFASLDAVAGAGVFLLASVEVGGFTASDAAAWHRNALLFGTIPAMLAGFLLTALPRWTGCPRISARTVGLLLGLWTAGRAASLVSAAAGVALAAVFLLAIGTIAAKHVLAGRDRRHRKIVLLLLGLCLSAALIASGRHGDIALRASLASMVGLLAVIGGRVVPALSAAWLEGRGLGFVMHRLAFSERFAATALVLALAAWIAFPQAAATGLLAAAACAGQIARLLSWRGWRTRGNWSILVLHLGYFWIAGGFGLLALHILRPDLASGAAAVHAWTVGAFGTLGIAIMSSMVRKHSGRPFSRTVTASTAFATITLSALTRLLAEAPLGDAAPWTMLSALLWVSSFGLFLAAFGSDLVPMTSANRSPASEA